MAVILTGTEYIEVPFAASLGTPSDEITVALWFIRDQVASDDNNYVLIRKDDLTYRLQKSGIGNSADQELSFRTTDDGLQGQVISDVVDNTPDWRFIVIRWAGGQAVQVDSYDTAGNLQATGSTGTLTGLIDYQGADGDIVIGGDGSNNCQGSVAGIYIHDVRLTNTQVTDLLDDTVSLTTDNGFTAPAITPSAGFWPLDFDARDTSGNDNDGTAVGDPAFTESPPAQDGSAAGSYGYAGTVSGQATALGSASGSYAYAGSAQGQATVLGSASGSYAYVGTAQGEAETLGSASGSYAYAGTASGQATVLGSASGAYGYEGTAIGTGEAAGVEPIILPPYREPALAAYREPAVPAFREPPS